MVPTVEVIGVYPVEASEPCHLVELCVIDCDGPFDLGSFTQRMAGQPPSDWQAPYDEKLLSEDGDEVVGDPWRNTDEHLWTGSVRLAFFMHHVDLGLPISTPFGDVALPAPQPRPQRLGHLEYEEP